MNIDEKIANLEDIVNNGQDSVVIGIMEVHYDLCFCRCRLIELKRQKRRQDLWRTIWPPIRYVGEYAVAGLLGCLVGALIAIPVVGILIFIHELFG